MAAIRPRSCPSLIEEGAPRRGLFDILRVLLPPALLIIAVLGSILAGVATPTESAAVGAVGAMLLAAWRRQLKLSVLRDVMQSTTKITAMVFVILLGRITSYNVCYTKLLRRHHCKRYVPWRCLCR